ncbi:ankyrin repeat protein [Carex littledalei]|uniref:Ankyrin repeat protein n=1 Tax=Carex littledalei TaxID=544730 RepID=A0A833R464_9POAL|nr:ankyrin repeat protein [Carex littledalei]
MVSELCDEEGDRPLHYAARLGHGEICEYLIKNLKIDVNLAAHSGKTPLCFAANFGDPNAIESLINCGANLNVKDANGLSPLHDAVIGDKPRAIEVLLTKGAQLDVQNFTGSPLLLATLHGHISCVKPNELLCGVVTPLLVAVMNNENCTFHPPDETKEIVKLLIKVGADVNKIPVLSLAYHSKELMEYLLESGANPNLHDESGRLPIEVAAMRGKSEVVEILFPVTSPIPTREVVSKKRLVDLKQKIKDMLFQKEYLAALVLCNYAIEEDPENASVYYAKRCLCWMHLGNALREMTGFMYMFNATTDADLSKIPVVIHTLSKEHLSEMLSFQMFLKLSLA